MLRTDQRALLVDLLTPPEVGYKLERAVGTTFTLHLESLLRVPLAVVGAEWRAQADPLGVMEAVRATADRIDVFCQAGMLHVPQKANPLVAFLEPMVHQVRRPAPGFLFHPKVWLVSYVHPSAERRFRLLCGSRNLTPDRTWDAVVALDGVQKGRHHAVNGPLADFVASLVDRVSAGVAEDRAIAIAELAEAVRSAEWEPPTEVTDDADWLTFHWIQRGRPTPQLLGQEGRRLLISPFLNPAGIDLLTPGKGELTVISRPESFKALGEDALGRLRTREALLYELNDGAALPDAEDEDIDIRWSLRGLHAKVLMVESGWNARVLIGSPNATDAAFSGNTEFAVELTGKKAKLGIGPVMKDEEGGLLKALLPFVDGALPEIDGPTLEEQLERALVDVAALTFRAVATETSPGIWCERVECSDPLPSGYPGDAVLSTRLLTTTTSFEVPAGAGVDLVWTNLEAEELTPFVALELRAGPTTATCVVVAPLSGAPDDRLDRMIARFVNSPEAFVRFLLLLLQLAKGEEADVGDVLNGGPAMASTGFGVGASGVLEAVALALAENPAALDDLGRLVERLQSTKQGRNVLPDGWDQLWAEVSSAREALRGGNR